MKKFMKKLAKKTEGFTLVELIVVIAILGILAGIAVPAYSGYLEKANKSADDQHISYVETIVQSGAAIDGKTADEVVSKYELDTDKTIKLTIPSTETDVIDAIEDFSGISDTNGVFDFGVALKYYAGVSKNATTGMIDTTDPS